MGFNVCDTFFFDGDKADPSTWTKVPGNCLGLARRVEVGDNTDNDPRGWSVRDQFGRMQSGMNDTDCGTIVQAHGQQHPVKCLWQYVAPTLGNFGFPDKNDYQETYPGAGIVELPN
jgi:hypothetical protein